MLEVKLKQMDICRICKTLICYSIKANVTQERIVLEGNVAQELIKKLNEEFEIEVIQNYNSTYKEMPKLYEENTYKKPITHRKVEYGEVYRCDFGTGYGAEIGKLRYAIVVKGQDDMSGTTVVLPCTTKPEREYVYAHTFKFSYENMLDYNLKIVGRLKNVVIADQIKTIDKCRLGEYLGKMNPGFMKEVKKIINNLFQEDESKLQVDFREKLKKEELLKDINISLFLNIFKSNKEKKEKIEEVLKLFGFNLNQNGVQYLYQAIYIASENHYLNLEFLSMEISNLNKNIKKEEVMRFMVARVKERIKVKKGVTIRFIHLISQFLEKKEI